MHDHGKSDSPVVPAKLPNNDGVPDDFIVGFQHREDAVRTPSGFSPSYATGSRGSGWSCTRVRPS